MPNGLLSTAKMMTMISSLTGGSVLDHSSIRVLLWIGVVVTIAGLAVMLSAISLFRKNRAAMSN